MTTRRYLSRRTVWLLGMLIIVTTSLSGCALAPSVLSAAGGATPAVFDRQGSDEGDGFMVARYDDVVQAALRAGKKLSLELTEQAIEEDRATLRFVDDQGAWISLRIERRTESVTQVHLDVSSRQLFGFGGLFGRQLIEELEAADAFLVEWKDDSDEQAE